MNTESANGLYTYLVDNYGFKMPEDEFLSIMQDDAQREGFRQYMHKNYGFKADAPTFDRMLGISATPQEELRQANATAEAAKQAQQPEETTWLQRAGATLKGVGTGLIKQATQTAERTNGLGNFGMMSPMDDMPLTRQEQEARIQQMQEAFEKAQTNIDERRAAADKIKAGTASEKDKRIGGMQFAIDKLSDKQKEYAAEARARIGEDATFTGLLGEGKVLDAIELGMITTAESLPAMIMGMHPIGRIILGITTAADEYDRLAKERPDMSLAARATQAVVVGTLEQFFESKYNPLKLEGKIAPTGSITQTIKEYAKRGAKENMKDVLKRLKVWGKDALGEGWEEVETSLSSDVVKTIIGFFDKDADGWQNAYKEAKKEAGKDYSVVDFAEDVALGYLNDFLGGAFAGGAAGGGMHGASIAANKIANNFTTDENGNTHWITKEERQARKQNATRMMQVVDELAEENNMSREDMLTELDASEELLRDDETLSEESFYPEFQRRMQQEPAEEEQQQAEATPEPQQATSEPTSPVRPTPTQAAEQKPVKGKNGRQEIKVQVGDQEYTVTGMKIEYNEDGTINFNGGKNIISILGPDGKPVYGKANIDKAREDINNALLAKKQQEDAAPVEPVAPIQEQPAQPVQPEVQPEQPELSPEQQAAAEADAAAQEEEQRVQGIFDGISQAVSEKGGKALSSLTPEQAFIWRWKKQGGNLEAAIERAKLGIEEAQKIKNVDERDYEIEQWQALIDKYAPEQPVESAPVQQEPVQTAEPVQTQEPVQEQPVQPIQPAEQVEQPAQPTEAPVTEQPVAEEAPVAEEQPVEEEPQATPKYAGIALEEPNIVLAFNNRNDGVYKLARKDGDKLIDIATGKPLSSAWHSQEKRYVFVGGKKYILGTKTKWEILKTGSSGYKGENSDKLLAWDVATGEEVLLNRAEVEREVEEEAKEGKKTIKQTVRIPVWENPANKQEFKDLKATAKTLDDVLDYVILRYKNANGEWRTVKLRDLLQETSALNDEGRLYMKANIIEKFINSILVDRGFPARTTVRANSGEGAYKMEDLSAVLYSGIEKEIKKAVGNAVRVWNGIKGVPKEDHIKATELSEIIKQFIALQNKPTQEQLLQQELAALENEKIALLDQWNKDGELSEEGRRKLDDLNSKIIPLKKKLRGETVDESAAVEPTPASAVEEEQVKEPEPEPVQEQQEQAPAVQEEQPQQEEMQSPLEALEAVQADLLSKLDNAIAHGNEDMADMLRDRINDVNKRIAELLAQQEQTAEHEPTDEELSAIENGAELQAAEETQGSAIRRQAGERMVKVVKDAGVPVEEISDADLPNYIGNEAYEELRTKGGDVYGFAKDGKIYVVKERMNPDTPLHEYTHIWVRMMRKKDPKKWGRIKGLLKRTNEWQKVLADDKYKRIRNNEEAVASEVMARLCGIKWGEIVDDSGKTRYDEMLENAKSIEEKSVLMSVRKAIEDFFRTILEWWNINVGKTKGFNDIVEGILQMPVKDLANWSEASEKLRTDNELQVKKRSLQERNNGDYSSRYSLAASLINQGWLIHGTNAEFKQFDKDKIHGGSRAHEGYGFYFSDMPYKSIDYGQNLKLVKASNFTFLDSKTRIKDNEELVHEFFYAEDEMRQYIARLESQLAEVRNNKEYDEITAEIEWAKEQLELTDAELLSVVRSVINSVGDDCTIGQLEYLIPSNYIPRLAYEYTELGFDGYKTDGIYTIFNFEKLNENVMTLDEIEEQNLFSEYDASLSTTLNDEEQRIKSEAKKRGDFMKAPDGTDTKLTEKQWCQVRTEAFKKWAGDWVNGDAHIFLDENGEPKVLYHGTRHFGFRQFDIEKSWSADAIFFADSEDVAKGYAGLMAKVRHLGEYSKKVTSSDIMDVLFSDDVPIKDALLFIGNAGKSEVELVDNSIMMFYTGEGGNSFSVDIARQSKDEIRKIITEHLGTNFLDIYANSISDGRMIHGIYATFVKSDNPLVIDAEGANWDEIPITALPDGYTNPTSYIRLNPSYTDANKIAKWAKEHGYDGVVIKNTYDTAGLDRGLFSDKQFDEYISLRDKGDIKSATDNNGEFNEDNPDIEFSIGSPDPSDISTKVAEKMEKKAERVLKSSPSMGTKPAQRLDGMARIIYENQDNTYGLHLLQQKINLWRKEHGKEPIPDSQDARSLLVRLGSTIASKITWFEQHEQKDLKDVRDRLSEKIGKSALMERFKEDNFVEEDEHGNKFHYQPTAEDLLERYLIARDNIERAEMKEGGRDIAPRGEEEFVQRMGISMVEYVKDVQDVLSEEEINDLWKAIRACTNKSITDLYESGRISKDAYEDMMERQFYVPEKDFAEQNTNEDLGKQKEANRDLRKGSRKSLAASVIAHKAKGGDSMAANIFENIIHDVQNSVAVSETNKVRKAMYDLMNDNIDYSEEYGVPRPEKEWFVKVGEDRDGKPIYERSVEKPSEEDMEEYKFIEGLLKDMRADVKELREKMKASKKGSAEWTEAKTRLDDALEYMKELRNSMPFITSSRAASASVLADKRTDTPKVEVYVNGDRYVMTFDGMKEVADALNGEYDLKGTLEGIKKVNAIVASLFTTYNPTFFAVNIARDTPYIMLKGGSEYGPIFMAKFFKNMDLKGGIDTRRAIYQQLAGRLDTSTEIGKQLYNFLMGGGNTGYTQLQDVKTIRKMLNNSKAHGVKQLGEIAAKLNEYSELLTRFTAYRTILEMGYSENEALNAAKNLSTNFNMRGAGNKFLNFFNSLSMFSNAAIQGAAGFYKTFNTPEKAKRAFALMVLSPAFFGFLNTILNPDDDDDEKQVADYYRDNYLCLGSVKIPITQELRPFWRIGVNFAMQMQGRRTAGDAAQSIISGFTEFGLPVPPALSQTATGFVNGVAEEGVLGGIKQGFWSGFTNMVIPQYAEGVKELISNKDFMGNPIVKNYDWSDMPLYTYNQSEAELYKDLAYMFYRLCGGNPDHPSKFTKDGKEIGLNFSPKEVKKFAGIFGSIGALQLVCSLYGLGKAAVTDMDVSETVRGRDIMLYGTFVRPEEQSMYRYKIYKEMNDNVKAYDLQLKGWDDHIKNVSSEAKKAELTRQRDEWIAKEQAKGLDIQEAKKAIEAYKKSNAYNVSVKLGRKEEDVKAEHPEWEEQQKQSVQVMNEMLMVYRGLKEQVDAIQPQQPQRPQSPRAAPRRQAAQRRYAQPPQRKRKE